MLTDEECLKLEKLCKKLVKLADEMLKLNMPNILLPAPGLSYGWGLTGQHWLEMWLKNQKDIRWLTMGIDSIISELKSTDYPFIAYAKCELPLTFYNAEKLSKDIFEYLEAINKRGMSLRARIDKRLSRCNSIVYRIWLLMNVDLPKALLITNSFRLTRYINWIINIVISNIFTFIKTAILFIIPMLVLNKYGQYSQWKFETWREIILDFTIVYTVFISRINKKWITTKHIKDWVFKKLIIRWMYGIQNDSLENKP